jgi:hypothetical protein
VLVRRHPALPVITLGAELTALRAYESGSGYQRADTTGYVLLAAASQPSLGARPRLSPAATCRSPRSTSTWPLAPPPIAGTSWLQPSNFELLVKLGAHEATVSEHRRLSRPCRTDITVWPR